MGKDPGFSKSPGDTEPWFPHDREKRRLRHPTRVCYTGFTIYISHLAGGVAGHYVPPCGLHSMIRGAAHRWNGSRSALSTANRTVLTMAPF